MTDGTVFNKDDPAANVPVTTPAAAPVVEPGTPAAAPTVVKEGVLEDLVGDGKKFKTSEDLARGKVESDNYITRLEQETRGLREDLAKKVNVDETIEQLRRELRESKVPADKPKDDTSPELTAAKVVELVKSAMTEEERTNTANQNVLSSNSALVKHFGSQEKANEHFAARAKQVGMTAEALQLIAEQSPTAFVTLMGLAETKPAGSAEASLNLNQSDVNPVVDVTSATAKDGTKAYFENMRKTDSTRYWTPETQNKIFAATKAGTYV